jgi:hypothetical protein
MKENFDRVAYFRQKQSRHSARLFSAALGLIVCAWVVVLAAMFYRGA